MWLQGHPDQVAAQHVLKGLKEGFRIGFQCVTNSWRPASSNVLSSDTNPQVVSDYLQEEVEAGKIIGPLKQGSVVGLQISPFGVISKGHTLGKWRLIVDLLSPQGSSVNDGIPKEACSVTYITCDEVADKVGTMGRGTMMAKVDLKSAYRMVPVHPEDRKLLGMLHVEGSRLQRYLFAFWPVISPQDFYRGGRYVGMVCKTARGVTFDALFG